MKLNWEELKISQDELNNIFESNLITSWAIAFTKVLLLRYKKYSWLLLKIECSLLFISLLFCFPIGLIFLRKLELLANNIDGLWLVIINTIFLSLLFLLVFNIYLWQKAKKLKLLSKLLEKVADYNNLVYNLQLIAKLDYLANKNITLDTDNKYNLTEFKTVIELTKNSLLNSIELESFIYNRQRIKENSLSTLVLNRDRLLAVLEHNLVDIALPEIDSNQEYQEILNEAINLGLSVHREIRKIGVKPNLKQ